MRLDRTKIKFLYGFGWVLLIGSVLCTIDSIVNNNDDPWRLVFAIPLSIGIILRYGYILKKLK